MQVPLPPPPVPKDLILRDVAEMPLHVSRLRDSELVSKASAEAFRAAVLLWCAAWHQVPAASLPADDVSLAHLAGFGRDVSGWMQVRADALRGFVPRSDGRLYHLVLCEVAESVFADFRARRKLSRQNSAKGKKSAAARRALASKKARDVPGYDPLPADAIGFTSVDSDGTVTSGIVEKTDEKPETVNGRVHIKNQEDGSDDGQNANHGSTAVPNCGSLPPAPPSPSSSPSPLINPLSLPPSTPSPPPSPQGQELGSQGFALVAVGSADADADAATLAALGADGKIRLQRNRGDQVPPCPVLEIVAAYHAALPECPRQNVLSKQTRLAITARWREDRQRQTLAWWKGYFRHIAENCPFLTGKTRHNFRADLSWLTGPKNFAKVCNGNYSDDRGGEA